MAVVVDGGGGGVSRGNDGGSESRSERTNGDRIDDDSGRVNLDLLPSLLPSLLSKLNAVSRVTWTLVSIIVGCDWDWD